MVFGAIHVHAILLKYRVRVPGYALLITVFEVKTAELSGGLRCPV